MRLGEKTSRANHPLHQRRGQSNKTRELINIPIDGIYAVED